MITAYATLKNVKAHKLIVQVCDEILAGQHHDMFPLQVWMTRS
jgi:fumarate hydratase class II